MDDVVTLAFPADTANVSIARTVAASMAARADMPLDQLEDARLAVDEAVTQLIMDAPDGSTVTCEFRIEDAALVATITADSRSGRGARHGTFSWTVLTSLAEVVRSEPGGGRVQLQLTIPRSVPVQA